MAYYLENYSAFRSSVTAQSLPELLKGALVFDTSAILYTHIPFALLMLLPLHYKEFGKFGLRWQATAKRVFLIVNAFNIIANLSDAVYFRYSGRRTTLSVFDEFSGESNLSGIVCTEVLRHWYLGMMGILLLFALYKLYKNPLTQRKQKHNDGEWFQCTKKRTLYYLTNVGILLAYSILSIGGMRGGFTKAVRPITISNANQYVRHPQEAALILNTPFSLIRTSQRKAFGNPGYFKPAECERLYSPIHKPCTTQNTLAKQPQKNIVVLIVESFGKEYIGFFNQELDNHTYKGFTPNIDTLAAKSLTFSQSYCNGRKSIDGMPSILSSIPMFVEPFFLTPSSMNDIGGLAGELKKNGYYSAFFHGAENGSMGFMAFARATGFTDYFGRTEYNQDKRFKGDLDYDGTWAIWDEPFLQYYALKMNEMKEPFFTSVFTASSHHPFALPPQYKDVYPEEGSNPIHKCIRYTDMALGKFFKTASRQPWFDHTIFVLTSDHTNGFDHPEYGTDLGLFSCPIIIYDPTGEISPGQSDAIAQQIDIMPTLLTLLGHDKRYVAFGKDLLNTPAEQSWAVNYLNGIYQFVQGDYLLQFDGNHTTAIYQFKEDKLLRHNLLGRNVETEKDMENQLKAIIQSYMCRMVNNELVIR